MILKFGSLIAFAISILAMIFLFKNNSIISDNIIAIIIQMFAFGLMIWARIIFGFKSFHALANTSKDKLVTNGPYKWLRHPIYAAVIYFFLACIISYPNIETIIAVALIILCTFARMILEEKALLENFAAYDSYYKRTKRLIPFIV